MSRLDLATGSRSISYAETASARLEPAAGRAIANVQTPLPQRVSLMAAGASCSMSEEDGL